MTAVFFHFFFPRTHLGDKTMIHGSLGYGKKKMNPDTKTFVQEEKDPKKTGTGRGQKEGQRPQEGQWFWQRVSRIHRFHTLLIYCPYDP